ncbi:unnamed protein product [Closterium sp. NIES-64]|nr:unnamed protein product [Closterium sp. NIES-64]
MRNAAGDVDRNSSGGLQVIAGSYERFLFGFRLHLPTYPLGASQPAARGGEGGERGEGMGEERKQEGQGEGAGEAALRQQFCYGGHTGPIKCVAAAGGVAVSGGADDSVRVYDLRARTDMGALLHHSAAVSCLAVSAAVSCLAVIVSRSAPPLVAALSLPPSLPTVCRHASVPPRHPSHRLQLHGSGSRPTHLLAGSEDRTISLWEVATWRHLSSLKGHKAPVNDIAVHPSGRVALSVARDAELRLWNLLQARCSFRTRLPAQPLALTYSPGDAACYALALRGGAVAVHCSADASLTATLPHPASCLALSFLSVSLLPALPLPCCIALLSAHSSPLVPCNPHAVVTGGEERAVKVWDVRQPPLHPAVCVAGAHSARIRGVLGALAARQGGAGGVGGEGNELAAAAKAGLTAWRSEGGGGGVGEDGEGEEEGADSGEGEEGGGKHGKDQGGVGRKRMKRENKGGSGDAAAAARWNEYVIVSAASDGCIRLWDLRSLSSSTHTPATAPTAPTALPPGCLSQVLTNARLTCLALSDLSPHSTAPLRAGKRAGGVEGGAEARKRSKRGKA